MSMSRARPIKGLSGGVGDVRESRCFGGLTPGEKRKIRGEGTHLWGEAGGTVGAHRSGSTSAFMRRISAIPKRTGTSPEYAAFAMPTPPSATSKRKRT